MVEKANKYDAYNWVIKVIKSSTTIQQLMSSKRLSRNFYTIYNDVDLDISLYDYADIQRTIIYEDLFTTKSPNE
tara:strand:+ start:569 stop:790 length:222 start_codon:yes stop_codon:yes gene_type:complete